MTNTLLILILEAAVMITSGLVLYCLYVINGLRATNKILDVNIEDHGKEIEYLQDSVDLGNKSSDNLAAIEESFAKYRGQTKVMMQKMKHQDQEINRLQEKLKKVNAQNSIILKQLQSVLKQSPELAKSIKTPLNDASKQHAQEQKMVSELKNHKVRLEAKAKVLEQRLKQTIVEKDFIEQRYVEFAEADDLNQTENLGPIDNKVTYQGRSNATVQ
jgi:uncharacterized protein (DUF3084 family)